MKKTILIPIAASIMCLGSLALVPSKVMKVSADTQTSGRYFLLDEAGEYGLVPGSNAQGTTGVAASASLSNPLIVEPIGTNQYRISIIVGSSQYYAKSEKSTTAFDLNIANASTWSLDHIDDNKYEITSNGTYTNLGFYNKNSVIRFGTTEGKKSDYNYTLTLLSVQDSVDSLVTAIKNVDCSTKNPTNSDWEKIGTAYNAIPRPVLNYLDLENAEANKDASDTTLEWAMAKYDYVCGKYNESKGFDDYLNRNPSYPTDGVNNFTTTKVESSNLTIIVTVMSLITVASVTSVLFFKRKRK